MQIELVALEQSGTFTNNGGLVRRFEAEVTQRLFGGVGGCVTVANATLGLILALKQSAERCSHQRPLAIMPSFTFAATGHAALWAGLQPVLCDIDSESWVASAPSEERLLKRYAGRVAALVPYGTFGNCIDIDRYAWLARRHDVDVVIDAAGSLGSRNVAGHGFGSNSKFPIIFSMHATKTFATAEGGLVYCADLDRLAALRSMAQFGIDADRSATMPGLNAKMTELMAMLALAKLDEIDRVVAHRTTLSACYRQQLTGFGFQLELGGAQARQFMATLLPKELGKQRAKILAELAASGVGAGKYFSPHLAEQPYFRRTCLAERLPVTHRIASRVLALPLSDMMTPAEVIYVCDTLLKICIRFDGILTSRRPVSSKNVPILP